MRRTVFTLTVALLAAAAASVGGAVAFAQATAAAAAKLPASSATLQPPQALTATAVCVNKKPQVVVSWSPSPSGFATSLTLTRAIGAGPAQTVATLPANQTSYTDVAVHLNKTYTYGLTASYLNWVSATPTAAATTANKC